MLGSFFFCARLQCVLRCQNIVDALRADLRLREEHEDHHKHHKRHDNIGCIGAEHDDIAEHGEPCTEICGGNAADKRRADPINCKREPVHTKAHRRLHQGKQLLVFHLCAEHFLARHIEFFVLIVLRVKGMHHIDAGEVFAGDAVDAVGELLHQAKPRQA